MRGGCMVRNLQFKTNSRHIGQLGRELVTDFVTALVELVKNAYDADAGSVRIKIEEANTPQSRIIITDTGSGMSQKEFEERWMVIGTSNKVSSPYTPKGRKKAGKKGIGRFSVERLAEKITLYSYTKDESFKVSVNWNQYEEISVTGLQQRIEILRKKKDIAAAKYIANQIEYYMSLKLKGEDQKKQETVRQKVGTVGDNYEIAFQSDFLDKLECDILPILKEKETLELRLEDIDNPLEDISDRFQEETFRELALLKSKEEKSEEKESEPITGLVMVLDSLRDNWRQKDIDKLQKELRLLVAPEFIEKDPFHIELIADQFQIPEELSVNSILDLSFAKVEAKVFDHGLRTEILYKDIEGKREKIENGYAEPLLCGDLTFELYFYLRDSVHMTNETYNQRYAIQVLNLYSGVKIYRDNFRVKPYGDPGNDWLGLDKSKISDTHSYRVGNNQTIGVIRISDEKNPLLCDATNREGIIENEAYEQLKSFVMQAILLISEIRSKEAQKAESELKRAKEAQKKQQEKEKQHQKNQDIQYQTLVKLLGKNKNGSTAKKILDYYLTTEKRYQEEKEKTYKRTESAYQKVVDHQETELSMYKNLATLGILASNFAHETQDIISRIQGSMAFYQELAPLVENAYFKTITENMVSDFKRISGYSSMILEFLTKKNRSPVVNLNLGEVLSGVCHLYVDMLDAFGISIEWNSTSNMVMTMRQIDLESIIINMITNAFEQVKGRARRKIRIRFVQRDMDIEMIFEDSGSGVPMENRKRIFDAFFTTKEEDGIGLGLNIVRDIVASYHGVTYVTDSEELGGAKFIAHFEKKEDS